MSGELVGEYSLIILAEFVLVNATLRMDFLQIP